jgi:hypothetical protein
MKSTIFFGLILLFLAVNVMGLKKGGESCTFSTECQINKCNGVCGCLGQSGPTSCFDSKDFCASNQKCLKKKKGGQNCANTYECLSNICHNNKWCGCTDQSGDKGCSGGHYCDSNKKCQLKKKDGESCSYDYECKSDCSGSQKICIP